VFVVVLVLPVFGDVVVIVCISGVVGGSAVDIVVYTVVEFALVVSDVGADRVAVCAYVVVAG